MLELLSLRRASRLRRRLWDIGRGPGKHALHDFELPTGLRQLHLMLLRQGIPFTLGLSSGCRQALEASL
jgi:hypothetical protein